MSMSFPDIWFSVIKFPFFAIKYQHVYIKLATTTMHRLSSYHHILRGAYIRCAIKNWFLSSGKIW
jgi:hypothetical protein